MSKRSSTLLHIIALLCVAAVAVALVSQHVFGLRPCAWCVFQRLIFLVIAAVAWLSVMGGRYAPALPRAGAAVIALLSVGGIVAAWYQYTVAAKLFSCDLTFADRFMVQSGLDSGVPWLFGIFASCMDARVELLGVEYAIWSMSLFVLTGVLAVVAALSRHR
jgi:disulfide bond formation protein DsbB